MKIYAMSLLAMSSAVAATCAFGGVAPVVVLPDSPTAVEKSAAEELAGELGKCLGEQPKVIAEADLAKDTTAASLFVGATKAAKKARADGSASRPYQVGVRWWTSDAATYPKLDAVPVKDISLSYAPQFKYRETYYLDGFDPLFKVRSKGNFTSVTRNNQLTGVTFIPPELGGNHRLFFFKGRHSAYHSFFEILPPKVYFEKHPEWYSLVKGKREPKQLCLANAEMKAEYIKETLKRLREDPSADFIQVSQNDWRGYCTCDKCKAMMDEDGGAPSGPYLRFANDVAEAVEKEFPNVRIDTFAYMFTRRAPTKTKPRSNVVVRLCDILCDVARPLAEPLPPNKADFAKDLADWQRVAGGNLLIWDYLADFCNYMMPHPNIGTIAPNIRLFAKNGAVGVFEQGDAICSAGSFATLRHYMTAHLLWDPKDDEKRLMDEFLEGYYGKSAAPVLKKFIAVIEAGPRKTRQVVTCYHDGAPFLDVNDKLLATKYMDEAVAAAAKDGEPFATRVRRERLSIDHMLLLNYDILMDFAAKLGYTWTRPATKAEAVENWIRDVKSFGVKARRETTHASHLGKYFNSLRESARPPMSATTVPMGNVRVGFTIETGEWKPSKDAKSGGGVGSDRALVHASVIPHGQMKSLSVTTNGNVVTAVWKGHPVCGENFTVTAKMTLRPDGGFEYTSFDYAGNESGQYPKRIVFPEVVVPRTAKTALFRPFFAGDILRPNWSKMKTMQRVYSSGLSLFVGADLQGVQLHGGAGGRGRLALLRPARRRAPPCGGVRSDGRVRAEYARPAQHLASAGFGRDTQGRLAAVSRSLCAVSRRLVRGGEDAPRVDGDAAVVQGGRRARLLEAARDRHVDVEPWKHSSLRAARPLVHEGDGPQGRARLVLVAQRPVRYLLSVLLAAARWRGRVPRGREAHEGPRCVPAGLYERDALGRGRSALGRGRA